MKNFYRPSCSRARTFFMAAAWIALLLPFSLGAETGIRPETVTPIQSSAEQNLWFATSDSPDVLREAVSGGAAAQTGQPVPWIAVAVPGNILREKSIIAQGRITSGRQTFWYKRNFTLESVPESAMAVRLGEISDRDRVYLNGRLIGSTGRWDDERPQAYDRERLYEIPAGVLKLGPNVMYVQVQGYFDSESGLYRGITAIGPARDLLKDYHLENLGQMLILMVYLAVALYFLLFFVRRRHDRENLYFSIFVLALVAYSTLKTQLKYELGFELFHLKRIQYSMVWVMVPAFYYFIRHYYPLPEKRWVKIFDIFNMGLTAVPLTCIGLSWFTDTRFWDFLHNNVVLASWGGIVFSVLIPIIYHIRKRNRDAILMAGGLLVMLVALIGDVLAGLAIVNLPALMTYAFTLFVLGMALILANRFVDLHNETEALNASLSLFNAASRRFVPFEFLRMLEKESITEVELGDQVHKDMTVLFSDIRSFTTLSEKMTPKENFDFINSYLRRVGPVIRDHDGFIDKYIGDAVMALFPGTAEDAVEAALDMQAAVRHWNVRRQQHNLQPIAVGIGLHKGHLMLGTIGESERMEGTVISDAVNLASRIESLTKTYGAAILISDRIYGELQNPESLHTRFVDRVIVKGKSDPVLLYEIYGSQTPELVALKDSSKGTFEEALKLYYAREFQRAEQAFTDIFHQNKDDAAAALYIKRCRAYKASPPPGEWNGVEALVSK